MRVEKFLTIDRTIAQWRESGWSEACIGEVIRDDLEAIEVCGINIELLNRTGSKALKYRHMGRERHAHSSASPRSAYRSFTHTRKDFG
jgi:hypothetical protein